MFIYVLHVDVDYEFGSVLFVSNSLTKCKKHANSVTHSDYSYKFDELTIEKWNANTNRYLGIYEHNDDKWEFKPN